MTAFSPEDLDRFRGVQTIAYECAERTAEWLAPGVTERQAAQHLRAELVNAGVEDLFHIPFAWFGDRSAFRGFRVPLQFFPTGRKLEDGMAYVLDCAPIIDGYTADIGYGGVLGESEVWDRLDENLRELRGLILDRVNAGDTLDEVYRAVDSDIEARGHVNRHKVYPGRVIGHQVTRQHAVGPRGTTVLGFGIRTIQTLGREFLVDSVKLRSPLWADGRMYRFPATPGLWAVEPHIAADGIGLKFEELLVVGEDGRARWLDDDVPHVRRWQQRAGGGAGK